MFDAMADWMTVPLLQQEAGEPPKRMGLAHTSISPYGAFKSRDGVDILISIQSDREWRVLAEKVLGDAALAADPDFATNVERVKRRAETDGKVAAVFVTLDADALEQKLAAADIAFARVNTPGRAGPPSASAPHHHRHAERAGVLSGAGRATQRRAALWSGAGDRRAHREGAGGIHGGYHQRKIIEGEKHGHRLHRSRQYGRPHGAAAGRGRTQGRRLRHPPRGDRRYRGARRRSLRARRRKSPTWPRP